MDIQANDLKRQFDLHAGEYEQKALEVLRSGWYVLGREVEDFEREFAEKIGTRHCAGLASGLDALWMAFRLLGIGEGDEVIVSANAYIACVMGITMNGATPVFVEPDEYDNIDADKIEEAISPKTAAILAVHLFGQSCDMDKIMDIARRRGLKVVEDCAQSHLTTWKGRQTGSIGDVGCFSFYPTKGLGAFGDGGAVTTGSDELADAFRVYRNYGSRRKYDFEIVGANSRLDELQAGLLRVKLKYLEELNEERRRIAARYLNEVSNELITMPKIRPGSNMVWHQFVIHSPKRDALAAYFKKRGIGTLIHYPIPPHLSKAYEHLGYKRGDFPITERAAEEVLSLPMFNGMREDEISRVIEALSAFGGAE
ncbi:MAG: DegT/DnrJ/EryC1/StrS family aminotransferase [Oscillospiraceae bacterium]|nr:DegT/DnrJ/EryC1/StrS family aminotransferase [Oscillospiraceae bacterium]